MDSRRRRFSSIIEVEAGTANHSERYIVKRQGSMGRVQAALLREAAAIFAEDAGVFVPRVVLVESIDAIALQKFEGETLQHALSWKPTTPIRPWFRRAKRIARLAARWLRRFHDATLSTGTFNDQLRAYVAAREDSLALLSTPVRDGLERALEVPLHGPLVTTHGDFTPSNLIHSDGVVCVVDLGIREWRRMSPAWDVATMLVGLTRRTRFSLRSPFLWCPGLLRDLETAFLDEYPVQRDDRIYATCEAVRHLGFLAPSSDLPAAEVRRNRWHMTALARAIGRLDESPRAAVR